MNEWPSTVRKVDPPIPVWVGVRKLLVLGTEILAPRDRAGLRIESEHPGLLFEWARREDGGLLGWATYQLVTICGAFSYERTVTCAAPENDTKSSSPSKGEARHRVTTGNRGATSV